jgi:16S rRNA (uracil1498-N3)-methyltransferase
VNLILFAPQEIAQPLPRADRRARHILEVLRRSPGETVDVGLIDGPRGKATVTAVAPDHLELTFTWGAEPPPLMPLQLVVGLPRPQTARDILRDATSLGVAALHFVRSEKGEPSYRQSSLWSTGEWRRHVIAGAEQAFETRLPQVTHGSTLQAVLADLPPAGSRIALDNYEAGAALGQCPLSHGADVVLAVGGERGWSAGERDLLRERGFVLTRLGTQVLRTETAVVAALAIVRARLGLM